MEDVELFVKCKYEWFQGFLDLPNGVPCSDTFARVFTRIDPEQFQDCFMDWVSSISRLTQGQVIAVDGKTLRRSHDRNSGKAAIHMVSAWATENSLVLGQTKVDEKSNEITAIPELLSLLDLSGCIVTIDDGLPEEDSPADCQSRCRLRPGGQGKPGEAAGGCGRPVFLRAEDRV